MIRKNEKNEKNFPLNYDTSEKFDSSYLFERFETGFFTP